MGRFGFGGGGGGGGVLGLGPAQNTFGDSSTADRAAAETLRDTYATANADWLALYNGNLSFWIRLVWSGGVVEQRRNAAGTGWEDVSNVIRGQQGDQGDQGVWYARIFMNAAAAPTAAPTGGSVAMDGTVTPPTGWVLASALTALTAGQETYESIAPVDPENDTFPLTPTWGFPFATGGGLTQAQVDQRIAAPARANNPSGEFDAARIPDLAASKITSGELDDARIPDLAASKVTSGEFDAGRIPDLSADKITTGELGDARIPAAITRDAEVKEFAKVGERGVRVGDMDSESAADNQVPTADGSSGVAWEAQQNAPPPPVGDHNRYAAVLAGDHAPGDFTAAHFLAGTSSQTDRITPPTATADSTLAFATPMALTGIAEEGSFEGNIRDTFLPAIGADNVTVMINGTAHVVTASEDPYSAVLLGTAEFILTEATS